MNAINPQWIIARRRAARRAVQFNQPHLDEPTCRRRVLNISKPKRAKFDKDHIVAIFAGVCLVSLFFIGG